jgi:hypothetical protein
MSRKSKSGILIWFMYVPLAANVAQTTEGTVGSSLSVSVLTTTATIGELIASSPFKLDYIRQRLYDYSRDGGKT